VNWDAWKDNGSSKGGRAVHHLERTMNDELSAILGKYEELVGKLQVKYGIAKDEATHRVDDYKILVEQLTQANKKLVQRNKTMSAIRKPTKHPVKLKASPKKIK